MQARLKTRLSCPKGPGVCQTLAVLLQVTAVIGCYGLALDLQASKTCTLPSYTAFGGPLG